MKLPVPLLAWIARSRNWGLERSAVDHGQQFEMLRAGIRLTEHFVPDPDNACAGYLLVKGDRLGLCADDLRELPVSAPERGVLALVTAASDLRQP